VWSKDLASGDKAVALLNFNDSVAQPVAVAWSMLGWPAGANVTVYDLWAHSTLGTFTQGHAVTVSPAAYQSDLACVRFIINYAAEHPRQRNVAALSQWLAALNRMHAPEDDLNA
jgi:hypothetical protein